MTFLTWRVMVAGSTCMNRIEVFSMAKLTPECNTSYPEIALAGAKWLLSRW